jgi:hypothetical protein
MTKKLLMKSIVVLTVLALGLTACSLPFNNSNNNGGAVNEINLESTVSARLTQIAFDALVAQMTQQALVSPTPLPTNTPMPTNTLVLPTATAVPPTATAIPVPCHAAAFIEDMTIKDGTSLTAGDPFVKTWRIKNTGTCSWTKDYRIVFSSGNAMNAPASVAFPSNVNPGSTVDLSVPMNAPGNTGDYTGNWMLKATNGTVFGVGAGGNVALTVVIKVVQVPNPKDTHTIYDFVKNYCSAQWRTNAGFINCPSNGIDFTNGSITRTYAPVLENGMVDDEGAIQTVPATGGDGMIQGQYPSMLIHSGDQFAATLMCSNKMTACSVTFELAYMEKGGSTKTVLNTWTKTLDGNVLPVVVDLSLLDGKEIIFFLKVYSQGNSKDDLAQWMAARVTHP